MKRGIIFVFAILLAGVSAVILVQRNAPPDAPEPQSSERPVAGPTETPETSDRLGARQPIEAVPSLPSNRLTSGWATSLRELKNLAAEAPDEAIQALAALGDRHEQRAAAVAVLPLVGHVEPEKALKAAWQLRVGHLADEPGEHELLTKLARNWGHTDLPQALSWADQLPQDEESRRDHVMKGIVSAVAAHNRELAGRLIASHLAHNPALHTDATLDMMRQWAKRDYAAALQWVSVLPPGMLRERALDELSTLDVPSTNQESANEAVHPNTGRHG